MNTKLPVSPAAIVACFLGIVGLLLVWLRFSLSIELAQGSRSVWGRCDRPLYPPCRNCHGETLVDSAPLETSSLPSTAPPKLRRSNITTVSSIPTLVAKPKPTELVQQETPPGANPTQVDLGSRQGALRVSNQTSQPVRLALLARQSVAAASGQPTYGNPAHWDFAPEEGSGKGLVLGLPAGNLKLKPGDILVAFAQDGSRRYWGPYVVSETALPVWNSQTGEWQLILK